MKRNGVEEVEAELKVSMFPFLFCFFALKIEIV